MPARMEPESLMCVSLMPGRLKLIACAEIASGMFRMFGLCMTSALDIYASDAPICTRFLIDCAMPAPEPVEVVVIWMAGWEVVKAGTQRLNSGYSRLEPVSTRVVAACAVPATATVAARARAA